MCENFFNSINKFLSYKVGEKHQKEKYKATLNINF